MITKPRRKILIVDDVELNRVILQELFAGDFDILQAENGAEAWALIQRYADQLDVVLLDIVMPVMNGFEVLTRMQQTGVIKAVPVILITGETNDEAALRGFRLGISDLINKPFHPEIIYRRVMNVVQLYGHNRELEIKLSEQAERLRQSNQFVIDALTTTVEFRNMESGTHIQRVRILTRILLKAAAQYYPMSEREINTVASVSVMHDIGKIAIPDAILLKPGKLTHEEFEIMKTHTVRGCAILESLDYTQNPDFYDYCYKICRYHHEKWDGSGYPDGLKGDNIPIGAQATSIADVYDALTSKRVYKEAYSHERAIQMILDGECGAFNPCLLECLENTQEQLLREIHISQTAAMHSHPHFPN